MLKLLSLSPSPGRDRALSLLCLTTGFMLLSNSSLQAETTLLPQTMVHSSPVTTFQPSQPLADGDYNFTPEDPLNSSYPIPWHWVLETQAEFTAKNSSGLRYYRSPALVSPDGHYAAYTRVQMQAAPELYYSRVTSVVFLENLKTGELQVIRASSPLAAHLEKVGEQEEIPGIISILQPVSWSADSNRLLCRQFEGFLSTSDATDYATIWERTANRTQTLTPDSNRADYTTAVLLGWSKNSPDRVLFRSGILGEEEWPTWSVATNGHTALASEADAIVYGEEVTHSWTGVQALR